MNPDYQRALSALQALDPATNRETWVRIAMAAKDAGLQLEDFTDWSSGAANFGGDRECQILWNSIKEGGVTKSTLFRMAYDLGWNDPGKPRQRAAEAIAALRPRSSAVHVVRRDAEAPGASQLPALEVWNASLPAEATHPYIVRKSGSPCGLRVIAMNSTMNVQGQGVAGWLAVPVWSPDGRLRTLQLIPPSEGGRKLNLPGNSFADGWLCLGNPSGAARVFIVEGIGQAWACREAIPECAAIVSFGAGRIAPLTAQARTRFPHAQVVIVADRGKEVESTAIALKHGTLWVSMPEDKAPNFDANDLLQAEGVGALAALLLAPRFPLGRYRVKLVHELMQGPPLNWLVRGVIPAGGLACMYGASGSGKTFLALDLCAAVAEGAEWFNRRVSQAPVVYVALEGEHGLRQRAQAWQVHHGMDLPNGLRFIMDPLDLRNPEDREELAHSVIRAGALGGLLVIDTLNRAAGGADENSSRDMGEIVSAAKDLQTRLGGTVLLIHHSGKDQTRGLRGHSSLHAALDAAIEVIRSDSHREWRIAKSKDDGDSATHPFMLKVVDLPEDSTGEQVTSCVVVDGETFDAPRRLKSPQGPTQKLVHEALGRLLRESRDFGRAGAPSGRPCVELEAAVQMAADGLPCRADQRLYQARRAITTMASKGMYQVSEEWIWDCQ